MAAKLSPIEAVPTVTLVLVRNRGGTHYARRGGVFDPVVAPSLCGAVGDLDAYARPRWRRVRSVVTCQSCHAIACGLPARVDRS